jgi:hypothetical protein
MLIALVLVTFASFGQTPKTTEDKIQIAFLLDVSGSMDQLILKARSQFWRLANYLETATKNKTESKIEFAIIIYGLDTESDFCKILTDFNSDLDSVAMNLHEIEVGGSIEYCWTTINKSLDELKWSKEKDDLKLIIIAGNESFNQETIDSKGIIAKARKMNVIINTIYCSSTDFDAMANEWSKAAAQTRGNYFSISLKDSLNLKENFLDNKLIDFNDKLNKTYIPFGPTGQKRFDRMVLQDKNSRMAGIPFFRERVIFKVGDSFGNPTWDLVDAIKADSTLLTDSEILKRTTLDFEDMNQLREFVDNKYYLRESYKEAIRLRYAMIKKYLGENLGDKDLDLAVKTIINKEGRKKGFVFKDE